MTPGTLMLLALGAAGGGAGAFADARVLEAAAVEAVPRAPGDAAWGRAKAKSFRLSTQRSVRLNDADANALLEVPGVPQVTVRALAAASELALLVEWPDATCDRGEGDEVTAYADAVALEVPVEFGPGRRLPYIGMGDEKAPVRLWQQRATKQGAAAMAFVAAGFGSLTRVGPAPAAAEYDAGRKTWRAVFRVPRPARGLLPVAFAVWDGARKERGGNKQLSGWAFLELPAPAADPAWLEALAWGYGEGPLGNAAVGKPLVEAVCAVCHHFPGVRRVPAGLAPDLSDVGAIATPAYLRDSIVDPSGVVVHHLHLGRRYDKTGARGPDGAYPAATGFAWALEADGGTASKMPSFAGFSEQQVKDMVAFLLTLQGESAP